MRDLQWDADRLMEQIIMQHSRHMQMGALVDYQLSYPDMTIKDFFRMASQELEEQEEELGYYEQRTITRTQVIPRRENGR